MNKSFSFLMLFSALAFASALDFTGPSYKEGCQCDPLEFNLLLEHTAGEGEVYALTIRAGEDETFTTFVTPRLEMSPHSSLPVVAFMTPHCDALPGEYDFTITAVGSRGTVLTATGTANIEQCHYLQIENTAEQAVCQGDEARYVIRLKNSGMFAEAGHVFTDLPYGLYELNDYAFDLSPGEEKEFNLYVTSPIDFPPQKLPFKISATSAYTYRDSYATFEAVDCTGMEIEVPDYCIPVNPGETVKDYVRLTNTGVDDSFDITAYCPPFVSVSPLSVDLDNGESAQLTLEISPEQQHLDQEFSCRISVESRKYGRVFEDEARICVQKLYDLDLASLSGSSVTVCKGDAANLGFTITNKGKPAVYSLSTTRGTISKASTSLVQTGTDSFSVSVETSALAPSTYPVTVKAEGQFHTETETVQLIVENCFESDLTVSPNRLDICAGETLDARLTLRNQGTRQLSFDVVALSHQSYLNAVPQPSSLTLNGGQLSDVNVRVSALHDAPDNADSVISLTASSARTVSSADLSVHVLPSNVCHAIALNAGPRKDVEVCKGDTFEITITNNGRFAETLSLNLTGPNWAFITPPTLTVGAGESKTAYVFYAPPYNTPKGEYEIVFTASNNRVSNSVRLFVGVYPVGGLGQQVPDYEAPDYKLGFEAPLDWSFEEGASRPVTFTLSNDGIAPLTNLLVYLESDDLQVLNESVAPITLLPGESRQLTLQLAPMRFEGGFATMVRAVANERFIEKSVTVEVRKPTLLTGFEGFYYYRVGNESFVNASINVSNYGDPVTVRPSVYGLDEASFNVNEFSLGSGEQFNLVVSSRTITEANRTAYLYFETGRGTYYDEFLALPEPSAATGFFVAAATLTGIILALLAALFLYYLAVVHGKNK
ncbi:hypothetical protein COU38_00485 [Candidatus Micrarchaeota archaeon CG10_big_fil_rev_8_21_14_0_10_54_18]|nr:MAG: hypothetical protein COU38_00485 [Candidatus Micrarchaeota archaeon CG10_big_fil_rev_8_21_14_0_10_54_18]